METAEITTLAELEGKKIDLEAFLKEEGIVAECHTLKASDEFLRDVVVPAYRQALKTQGIGEYSIKCDVPESVQQEIAEVLQDQILRR